MLNVGKFINNSEHDYYMPEAVHEIEISPNIFPGADEITIPSGEVFKRYE